MKIVRKLLISLVVCLAATFVAGAASTVSALRISVFLDGDGSARISEQWSIDVSDDISEWYLVMANLGIRKIHDFGVQDETGRAFEYQEHWNIDWGRGRKAQCCGIVERGRGSYELCWGVGSSGKHVYTASYTVEGIVSGYSDSDGMLHQFVARGLGSCPEKIEVVIRSHTPFSQDNARIWGFNWDGTVTFENGAIVARTTGRFSQRNAVTIMAEFNNGIFSPALIGEGTFAQVKDRAFDGSDYGYEEEDLNWKLVGIIILSMFAISFIAILAGICKPFRKLLMWIGYFISFGPLRIRRRRIRCMGVDDPGWHREIPAGSNLVRDNAIVKRLSYGIQEENTQDIIAAYLLRLINNGALSIRQITDRRGKTEPLLCVEDVPEHEGGEVQPYFVETSIEKSLYNLIKRAAGSDSILQKNEMKKLVAKDPDSVAAWYDRLKATVRDRECSTDRARELLGLKKFLEDFTLSDERHVADVALWDEYLVYATLFGCADKVSAEIKRVYPDYYQMARARSFNSSGFDPVELNREIYYLSRLMRTSSLTARNAVLASQMEQQVRTSGGGGHVSFGGGGGFTGGGFGGGGR